MNYFVPECSVVIPSHNALKYLPKALLSIQGQHIKEVEIIVANDNSNDGTQEWLEKHKALYPTLKILNLPGVGPAKARNEAIKVATGTYIAFLDADDTWQSGKLLKQLAYMQRNPDVVLSFTDYRNVYSDGKVGHTCFSSWPQFAKQLTKTPDFRILVNAKSQIFAENVIGTSTVVCRKDALLRVGLFDPELPSAEDWDLWLKLADVGKFALTERCHTQYLVHAGSETTKDDARLAAIEIIQRRHGKENVKTWARRIASVGLNVGKAEFWLARKKPLRALPYHIKALCLAPDQRRLRETLADIKKLAV